MLLLSLLFIAVFGRGLRDDPIVGALHMYLDGQWRLTNGSTVINGKVPGDLITDLQNAGIVGDPNYENNWLKYSPVWNTSTWTYSTTFSLPNPNKLKLFLIFDGIKMGSVITLNGKQLGHTLDQFLRYGFPIDELLQETNTLQVSFPSGNGLDCQGRFMACTGGWDWSPYSDTYDQHGAHTLSKGIWKSVYIVGTDSAVITYVVPHVHYIGNYPTAPLSEPVHKAFEVRLRVHFFASETVQGHIHAHGEWAGGEYNAKITIPQGESHKEITLDVNECRLWWPNGLGDQKLYSLRIQFKPEHGGLLLDTSRRIGFRTFALVTANDTDPNSLKGVDGSGKLTMRYKINGANIWARGGNMIPMENYEGRANEEAFKRLVRSAHEAHFNTFRIWGGGIFYYDVFYDMCDELGIVMYHDMMYAQEGHAPTATILQDAEIKHQVRRLSHHPSIVMWDGCNECTGLGLYNSFVMHAVRDEDRSRPIWPSCPAAGYDSGVDRLWGLPNDKPATVVRPGKPPFETHGPYQHGTGFKAVNDPDGKLVLFPANVPPTLKLSTPKGLDQPGVFASEFGCVGMSSFESMSATLSPDHWSLHSSPMYQRNYPCDNIIVVYWGNQDFSKTGEAAFKRQLYQCLIGQALEMKSDIEARRSTNEFGTVLWQLNEIWPTGGWGSIEYGSPGKGQVIGGRWKPVHYWLESSLFTDVMATCGAGSTAVCYAKNDSPFKFGGELIVSMIRFNDGKRTTLQHMSLDMAAGASTTQTFCAKELRPSVCMSWTQVFLAAGCSNASECIMELVVREPSGRTVSNNVLALTTLQNMKLPAPRISFTVSDSGVITLSSDRVALYVTLTTQAQGRFSENAFLMDEPQKKILFMPFTKLDINLLRSTLRVEHVQQYL